MEIAHGQQNKPLSARLKAFHFQPEYSGALVKPMSTEYCIEPAGPAFIVVDPAGEQVEVP
jgi:hypothetical protein